jgi:3-(3-hydroxy-phenyl)propionate hydroxylase
VFRVLQSAGVAEPVLARSRPMAGLRLLDGPAPGARRVPALPDAGPARLAQGSLRAPARPRGVLAAPPTPIPGITVERGVA